MKSIKCLLLLSMVFGAALCSLAQDDQRTEIQGFFQTYRNFSWRTGASDFGVDLDIPATKLNGGGFSIARDLAPWFALCTQLSFFGSPSQPNMSVRIINNLEGFRYQTKQHGPFRFYAKGGLGFTNYSIESPFLGSGGDTKFSFSYGGGAQIWMSDRFGINLELSHVFMGLPNLFSGANVETSREKWDSGLTYTTGFAVRF